METIFDIRVKLLRPGAQLPTKAHESDTCWDVRWCPERMNLIDKCFLPPGESRLLGTGLRIKPPQGYGIQMRPRSGLAARNQIIMPNAPGTIDEGYRGEVFVNLMNLGKAPYIVMAGDRIAQICLERVVYGRWIEAEVGTETDRGTGGHGSTGR